MDRNLGTRVGFGDSFVHTSGVAGEAMAHDQTDSQLAGLGIGRIYLGGPCHGDRPAYRHNRNRSRSAISQM